MTMRADGSRARRDSVLRAAGDLLDEKGIAGLTIRGVAERAGVASGSVFLYARNKRDLVNQVFGRRVADRWHRLLDDLTPLPPLDRIEAFYVGCVDIFYADSDNVRIFYQEISHAGSLAQDQRVSELMERLRGVIADGMSAGDISAELDVRIVAMAYSGIYSNVLSLVEDGVDHDTARDSIASSLHLLRRGVENETTPR